MGWAYFDTFLSGKVRKVLEIERVEGKRKGKGFLKMGENISIHFEKSSNGFEHLAYLCSEDPECSTP
jgi:hypothetical protein